MSHSQMTKLLISAWYQSYPLPTRFNAFSALNAFSAFNAFYHFSIPFFKVAQIFQIESWYFYFANYVYCFYHPTEWFDFS